MLNRMAKYIFSFASSPKAIMRLTIFAFFILVMHPLIAQVNPNFSEVVRNNFEKIGNDSICSLAKGVLEIEYQDERTRVKDGTFTESQDGKIVIFQFEIESCGAYCNSFYESVIVKQSPETKNLNIHNLELAGKSDSILSLSNKNMYLFMGQYSGRPRGVEGIWCLFASLIDFSNGFNAKVIQQINSCQSNFSNLGDDDSFKTTLSYNSKNESIDFEFTWYEEADDIKIFTEKGKYTFNGSSFIETEIQKKYLDIKN